MTTPTNMRILAIVSGDYGHRHVENIRTNGPSTWTIETWSAPSILPPVIDYPEDYLPGSLPPADLLLSFAEHKGVAELLPEIAQLCGAKSAIAGVDSEAWLPRGLARQLRGWMEDIGVVCVTPKPLCSLGQNHYMLTRRKHVMYDDPRISEFAAHFGHPDLHLRIDPDTRTITEVVVVRDAVCGCARFAAERLVGVSVDDAEEQVGLLHHHYPCLASMGIDSDYADTLMHVSGNILKENVAPQLKPYLKTRYFTPGKRSE
ncbi:MAG TPA: hypothetical protein G4N94_02210 [Caldilineae bacterium]|nr:hypothetical protein [Caldilineae bacterium]